MILTKKIITFSQTDVDENRRPDLLVGVLLSEEAVLLRALPVLQIKPRSFHVSPPKAVNPTDQSTSFYGVVKI